MGQYLSDNTAVLNAQLEKVKDVIEYLVDFDDVFLSDIEKVEGEVVSSVSMRVPVVLGGAGNFGHFNLDGGSLGVGSGPTVDKAVVPTVQLKQGMRYTRLAELATDSGRKAVMNTVKELLKLGAKQFRRNLDSLCMTAGNGVLGTISAISTATYDTYTLASDGFGARLFHKGMPVSVFDSGPTNARTITAAGTGVLMNGGVGATSVEISSVDLANKKITIRGTAAAVAAGDKIVVNGQPASSPVSLLGIPYHNNTSTSGTWLGFTRSSIPEVVSPGVAAGGPLALSHARLLLNKISDRVGLNNKGKLTAYSHPCQKQAYEELGFLVTQLNKSGGSKELDLYFEVSQLAGVPLKTSNSWDKTRIDIIDRGVWGRAVLQPAGFYEENGQKIFEARNSSGEVLTAADFFLYTVFNLYTRNPVAGGPITGLTVPFGY
jgi:hypothetical protein